MVTSYLWWLASVELWCNLWGKFEWVEGTRDSLTARRTEFWVWWWMDERPLKTLSSFHASTMWTAWSMRDRKGMRVQWMQWRLALGRWNFHKEDQRPALVELWKKLVKWRFDTCQAKNEIQHRMRIPMLFREGYSLVIHEDLFDTWHWKLSVATYLRWQLSPKEVHRIR